MSELKYWVCPSCGGVGRATHRYFGRCLTPKEVEEQKVRLAVVQDIVEHATKVAESKES